MFKRFLAKTSLPGLSLVRMVCQESFILLPTDYKRNELKLEKPMETGPANNVNDFIETLISSYESRIKNIETVFNQSDAITESSFGLLKDFSNSLKDYKAERETINSQLRENLSKNGSLRKKDYNRMMEDVLNRLDEKELEAENYFYQFIEDQKAMTQSLKRGILEVKDNLQNNNTERINNFRAELVNISQALEEKKEVVVNHFLDYQKIHHITIDKFKMLLAKGDRIFVREVKEVHQNLLSEIA